nr:ribonuclease H-like domain-containing protein [Tanacetum cinerariifolium]
PIIEDWVSDFEEEDIPQGNPQQTLKDKGVIDSGCSRHMTGNISYLFDFKELNGGYVAFGCNPKGGKITGKGFQDTEKAGEEGTQTYVLFPVLSDGSTNPKNNKDAHTGGNKHNDDIQNTNDFSAAGPSNAAMPNLEDLSHNADDVGVEADTNNMESVISVSPILTTRIHKDHPTSQ